MTDYLTHPRLHPGQSCPVTRPQPTPPLPEAMRQLLNGSTTEAYGSGQLWVLVPTWEPNAAHYQGRLSSKIGWFVGVPGPLQGAARRLDGSARQTGRLDAPHQQTIAPRMQASSLIVPAEGCWEVAARVADQTLVFIYRIQADP